MAEASRKTVSILFGDVAGHGAEDRTPGVAAGDLELMRAQVEEYRGQWVGAVGGGVLSTFATAASAMGCALAMQRASAGDGEPNLRVGIHTGELEFRESPSGAEVFGDPIVVAARLPELAEAGGICLSGQVHEQLPRARRGLAFEYLGERQLKSVARPVPVYRVVDPVRVPAGALDLDAYAGMPRRMRWLLPLATATAAAGALVAAFWVVQSEPVPPVEDAAIDGAAQTRSAEQRPESPRLLAFRAARDELLGLGPAELGARVRTIPDPVKNGALYQVEFAADCECTVLLFAINGSTDEIALLYPNNFEPRARTTRGATVRIPSSQEWKLRAVGHEGVDVLKLVAVDAVLGFPNDRSRPWVATPDRHDRVEELKALLERVRSEAWGTATTPLRITPQ